MHSLRSLASGLIVFPLLVAVSAADAAGQQADRPSERTTETTRGGTVLPVARDSTDLPRAAASPVGAVAGAAPVDTLPALVSDSARPVRRPVVASASMGGRRTAGYTRSLFPAFGADLTQKPTFCLIVAPAEALRVFCANLGWVEIAGISSRPATGVLPVLKDSIALAALREEQHMAPSRALPVGYRATVEFDAQRTSRTGRIRGYLILPTGRLLNAQLVEQGLAVVDDDPSTNRYDAALQQAQRSAQRARVGLWALPGCYGAPGRKPLFGCPAR